MIPDKNYPVVSIDGTGREEEICASRLSKAMHQVFTPAMLDSIIIDCSACSWKGKAEQTIQEHLFLTDATELYCPQCNNYLGFVNEAEEEE